MKNIEQEETTLANIERDPRLLILIISISAVIVTWGVLLLKDVNPLGFVVLIPGSIFSFQSLWLLLHPFARVYEDKIEIRQSFLHSRIRYYVDLKKVSQEKGGKIFITYNDDEIEKVNLFGIRESQRSFLKEQFQKHIAISLGTRT